MKKLLTLMFVSAGMALAQTPPATAPPKPVAPAKAGDVVRVLNIKGELINGYSSAAYNTLRNMYPTGSGVEMSFDASSRTIIVRGPASAVKLIEDTLKVIDVPPAQASVANIEVTIQLLYASSKEDAKGVPTPDLQSTVQELRKVFPYASYRVMDVLLQRGRDGRQISDGGDLSGTKLTYDLSYTPNIGSNVAPRTVRFNTFQLQLYGPTPTGGQGRMNIRTDVDAREGQKTVVGKMNVPGTEDAIFLVVTPKVIQ